MEENVKKHKGRLWKWVLLIVVVLLAAACALGYRNRVEILDYLDSHGVNVPYELLEKQKEAYGYYGRAVDAETDLDTTVTIQENDSSADKIETAMEKEDTQVASSLEIDAQIEAELDSGNDTWEEPLTILNPYQISPLTAVVVFETEEETAVRVTVKGKTEETDVSGETDASTRHRVPVIGLYPDTENTVILELLDENGKTTAQQEIKIQTDALPTDLMGAVTPVTTAGSSAYGLTMVYGQQTSFPFAFDCAGDIRWYLNKKTASYGLFNLSDDRFIFQDSGAYTPGQEKPHATNMYEMDYLGRAYKMYYVPGGIHHEVIEKEPGGNLLVLTSTFKLHYEDAVVEIDRETGEIVSKLELEEIFDVDGLFSKNYVDQPDWAHINTVSWQADSDTVLLSCRNIHSVIKVNWTTHELEWILCDPEFWEGTEFEDYVLEPTEEFTYFFQQHSAYQLSADLDGNPDTVEISLFDNHFMSSYRKVGYYDKVKTSYAQVYSVDEKNGTVSQLKSLPLAFSTVTSNTVYDEESGHIFGMCGTVWKDSEGYNGRIYEFNYETGETINEFALSKRFYRATEMKIDYSDLASAMETDGNYICGSLRAVSETKQKVETPEKTLPEDSEVTFKLVGGVMYVGTYDHRISQIILKGGSRTYVWDSADIRLYSDTYLVYYEHIPVPLEDLETDTYEVLCVYQDELCQTGQSFTIQ